MLLLAGFQLLLHRYTNQDDIPVGVPIANRTRGETEGLIGFFVNTLVMRGRVSNNPSFRELLRRVKETALGAYAHQDLPFETLVDALTRLPGGPERSLSYSPLFQVLFNLQSARGAARPASTAGGERLASGASLRVEPLGLPSATSPYDLTLSMADTPDGFRGTFEYNVDLFDEATMRRMAGHFERLLAAAVADQPGQGPDTPIGYLPLLTAAERAHLAAWNAATAVGVPLAALDHPIYAAFEDWAERTPDAPAAVFVPDEGSPVAPRNLVSDRNQVSTHTYTHTYGERLTYGQLNARANQLAHWLIANGFGGANGARSETLVGIAVERSLDMVVALLATLKAGAAYLPLDPAYPADRLQFMLADSGVELVLTQAHLLADRPWLAGRTVFCLDRDWPALAAYPETNPSLAATPDSLAVTPDSLAVTPDSLAYVIYTSGSTGRPKGVLVAHRGLTNLVLSQTAAFGLVRQDGAPAHRILQFASFSFDAAVSETFMALATGATLYLAPQPTLADLAALKRLLQQHAISAVTLPPSLLALLDPAGLDSLQCLISAGERLPAAVAARWAGAPAGGNGRRLFNAYGPTEATIGPTLGRITLPLPPGAGSAPVGRPIANTAIYIRDRYGNPAPLGVPGELCIAGVGLARGYLGRPDLTAERFVPHSTPTTQDFQDSPATRLYRTGDLARLLPDGAGGAVIEILGRIDQQVKLRGFRIELGEIEAVLRTQPGVRDAVALVRQDAPAAGLPDARLLAYVVADPAADLQHVDWRTALRARLPDYMLPNAVILLDAFPLTPNGKVDRAALQSAALRRPEWGGQVAADYVEPATATEIRLAELWAGLLHAERVGRDDTFFDLGGHSLLATQLISRVRDAFGLELPLRTLFEWPSLAGFAGVIDHGRGEGWDSTAAPTIMPAARQLHEDGGSRLPLSFAQQRLWFLDRLEPDSPLYNLPTAMRLEGALDRDALGARAAGDRPAARGAADDVPHRGRRARAVHRATGRRGRDGAAGLRRPGRPPGRPARGQGARNRAERGAGALHLKRGAAAARPRRPVEPARPRRPAQHAPHRV